MKATKGTPEARILVVDDEANIAQLLATSLKYAGFEVRTADNGVDALETARTFGPDLLLLDVMMPGLDGFDVLRSLRGGGNRTPVLFLTARDAAEDRVAGLTLGGDDYVTKPFSLEEVVARIRAILRRTAATTARAPAAAGSRSPTSSSTRTVTRHGRPATRSSSRRRSSSCCATSCRTPAGS